MLLLCAIKRVNFKDFKLINLLKFLIQFKKRVINIIKNIKFILNYYFPFLTVRKFSIYKYKIKKYLLYYKH